MQLQNNTGRLYATLIGSGMIIAACLIPSNLGSATHTMIVGGATLVGSGTLTPWLRRVGWGKASAAFEDPELQRVRLSREISEEQSQNRLSIKMQESLDATRYFAATLAIQAIFTDAQKAQPGFEVCQLRFFMYDKQQKRLFAVLRPDQPECHQRGWKLREGVTGMAYATGKFQIATGAATHDGTYNLDEDDQKRYAHLTEVAAMPVMNAGSIVVGVLSASHDTDKSILGTEEWRGTHQVASDAIARVVVDLLGWYSDDKRLGTKGGFTQG
ncbi:MAG: GAF domain-containing protein [Acidimicrobiia bacterium]|nr:GAF domain-containing protein [Acidimicrobiia bacterium]MYC57950.1 GAF domain-containing protein [Acidimicrobiia bacterium]MYG94637.1 GAF domain-containing protein [Acidimicrobiia bacterium]MYI30817.1 GAF domain-containing protein [Acidimicrobiia bacterium]